MVITLLALLCLAGLLYLRLDYESRLERSRTERIQRERELEALKKRHANDLRATQNIRRSLSDQSECLSRAKQEFLEAISHELRTPLTGIQASLEFIEEEASGIVGAREWLDMAQQSSRRLEAIVGKAEEMVQITSSLALEENQIVPLAQVVREVWDKILLSSKDKDMRCRFYWSAFDVSVPARRKHLVRLLELLVGNALQFTPAGHQIAMLCMPILDQDGNDTILFQILDEGQGVPEGEEQRIFEPFHQVRTEVDPKPPGLGLGLSICRSIAASLGAKLQVRRREEGGSCFCFELPCLFANADDRLDVPGTQPRVLDNLESLQLSREPEDRTNVELLAYVL